MHLQQYDENRRVHCARTGRHSEKADGNVTMHAQPRIIYTVFQKK